MPEDVIRIIEYQIDSGIGDTGRLQFILDSIRAGKPLYQCDKNYLEKLISNFQRKSEHLKDVPKPTVTQVTEKKTLSEHLHDYRMNSRSDYQNTIYLKSIIEQKSEMEIAILDLKNDLQRALEKIKVLEDKLRCISVPIENKSPDFPTAKSPTAVDVTLLEQNLNNNMETREPNQNNSRKKAESKKFAKVLAGVTFTAVLLFLTTLILFGTFEGKSTWGEYHLTFEQAKSILTSFLFILIAILIAWIVFGIGNLITFVKAKKG